MVATDVGDGLPVKAPTAVGMSGERLAKIDHVVERGIAAGGYPGAAVVVGRRGAAVWEKGFGRLSWTSSSPAVTADRTIYDLASLTKVVGTTTAVMVLYDEGKIRSRRSGSEVHPRVHRRREGSGHGPHAARASLRPSGRPRSLAHRAHARRSARRRSSRRRSSATRPLLRVLRPRRRHARLRRRAASGRAARPVPRRARVHAARHDDTYFRPADSLRARIAPTEVTPPRGYPLHGEVHDENAYALGGVAGHAGLFSTADDLAIFAQMMLNGGKYNGTRIVSRLHGRAVHEARGRHARARLGHLRRLGQLRQVPRRRRLRPHRLHRHVALDRSGPRHVRRPADEPRARSASAKRPAKVIADVRADLADAAALAVTDYADGSDGDAGDVPRRPGGRLEQAGASSAQARRRRSIRVGAHVEVDVIEQGRRRASRKSSKSSSKAKASHLERSSRRRRAEEDTGEDARSP